MCIQENSTTEGCHLGLYHLYALLVGFPNGSTCIPLPGGSFWPPEHTLLCGRQVTGLRATLY